jgi:SAM-dependent methyltransferase
MFEMCPSTVERAAVTERVRSFYERHPYPPPIDDLGGYRRRWSDPRRRRAEHHLYWPGRPVRERLSILIAGCGTSQAVKHALRWPAAQVTAIDFSAASVRATEALKRKYDLGNLQVRELAVERAPELGGPFDQIICTGVLHHLADPDAGLAALRAVLAPGGSMHLMVYAPYGRTGVYMMQELCQRLGIEATAHEIPELVRALAALPAAHPLAALLRTAPDFRDPDALADALLHPQDRAYSVPQLFDFLARGGFSFVRWLKQAPYSPRCGVLARLPQSARIAGLPAREQFAVAELFRGTMVRHSAIVARGDDPEAAPVSFAGETWKGFVPIPLADTIAVRERLPPGAAAVLINRGHTDPDLYFPIDERSEPVYGAIDGLRTIGEIARLTGAGDQTAAFFERLYWHDQIALDTSRARGPQGSP